MSDEVDADRRRLLGSAPMTIATAELALATSAQARYVLALQEASVIAIADAFAQATRRPALVNLHHGHGEWDGNIATAFQNKTPLIVTAGQQTRELLLMEQLQKFVQVSAR
jgi:thiamine pyrophosphate-dependent acetolactate synthase large subunit-like protein